MPTELLLTLNAPLRPDDRGRRYEDPLQKLLDRKLPGSQVTGGETRQNPDGELVGDPAAGRLGSSGRTSK